MADEPQISTRVWLREFIDRNFDKGVLLVMLSLWIAFVLHMLHHGLDRENVAWGREQASAVQGAILGMITGVAIGRRVGGGSAEPLPPGRKVEPHA